MNIDNQVSYWKYAAWTLPLAALAGIVFFYWIGWDGLLHKFIITVCTVFFSVSVFWWWWALHKLGNLIKEKFKLLDRLTELTNEIKKLRKDIEKK
jgi:hypothetical protein